MAEIYSISGNPLRDGVAVHFPVSSGEPVYPTQKSNVIIGTDGAMEYGSVEDTVAKTNNNLFTTGNKYKASDGSVQISFSSARSISWISKDADKIIVDNSGYVTGIELSAWNSSGTYVGVWDAENETYITNAEKFYTEIDFKKANASNSTYKYKLSFTMASGVTGQSVRAHILWVNTDYELTKKTTEEDHKTFLFDLSTLTIVDGKEIHGNDGTLVTAANYVSTGYIDISTRVGNVIEFNGTILNNLTGFSVYDRGFNWIQGMWGNKTDRESMGFISDYCPQHIVWTVPENACYIRACMHKDYYTAPSDFNFVFLMTNKGNIADRTYYDSEFISIAHKGYGDSSYADTLAAFIGAGEAGFTGIEIDCRRTTDGVYVVSHNDTNTLYSGGTSSSVTISTSAWEDLKGMTWDAAGDYPLCTLAQVFNTMKRYKVRYYIIDLKTGTNAEIMKLARRCGVVSQVMLSYYTKQTLMDDLTLIAEYPQVAVRFTPSLEPSELATVKAAIKNELFADVNLSDGGTTYFPKALSLQLPILFSGVQESNKYAMAALGAGGMAQTTLQYSPYDFAKMIALDFNQFPTLTTETESVSISSGTNGTVTVESDINDPACYVYGYSDDLDVCNVSQNAYGAEVTFTVSRVGAGSANMIVFTPTGEQLIIPVTAT